MKILAALFLVFTIGSGATAEVLPAQPTAPNDPGSAVYQYTLYHQSLKLRGRKVDFFAPNELLGTGKKIPLIVFGHGQGIGIESYQATLEHLARKGVAVVFPYFDTGFFDRQWERMGIDYVNLTSDVVSLYSNLVDPEQIVFAGHSKGAYVALNAASLAPVIPGVKPAAVVAFEPAGYLAQFIDLMDPNVPVTITHSDADKVVKSSLINEIYTHLPSRKKQIIFVSSYTSTEPEVKADHFFPLTKAFLFGGHTGISPLHYYGTWKWLLGAAWDLQTKNQDNDYIYGTDVGSTGLPDMTHKILRNY